jgi:hypothetical protein
MATEKKERLLTPVGEAKWAHVHIPKEPFAGDKDKGKKYSIDVVFDPTDPAWKAWGADIKSRAPGGKGVPIKQEKDEGDNPTGRYFSTFKTGEQYPPRVFDKYGKEIPKDVLIGNGSKVRVSFTPATYEGFGGGLTLYLSAVQVLELVEYKGRSADAYGFDVEQESTRAELPPGVPPEDELPF